MTKEEILEKAKKDYPVGTIFKPAHIDTLISFTIKETDKITWYQGWFKYLVLVDSNNNIITIEGISAVIVEVGKNVKWAPIIKQELNDALDVIYKD